MAKLKTLAVRIRELREGQDFSVRELAKKVEVSAAFMSDVELGRRHPSPEVLARIAKVLKTTSEDLESHDARAPLQELRRMAASDPAMGFALRRVVDEEISAAELLAMLQERKRKGK